MIYSQPSVRNLPLDKKILKEIIEYENKGTQFLVEAAAIGAIYVVLTVLFAPLSYGEVRSAFLRH